MFFINNSKTFVKCSADNVKSGYVAIDEELNDYISTLFGKRVYGEIEVSTETIAKITKLNQEIVNRREETEKEIKSIVKESGIKDTVSAECETIKRNADKDFDKIETDEMGNFILYKRSEKTKKILKYRCIDFANDKFTVISSTSKAGKRKARSYHIPFTDFLNGKITKIAVCKENYEKKEKELKDLKAMLEEFEAVA